MGGQTTAQYCVAPADPAVQGHFPGAPVVPAAVLMRLVERTLAMAGQPLTTVERVKFLRPVAPGETIDVRVEPLSAARGRMTLSVEGEDVAVGTWLSTPS